MTIWNASGPVYVGVEWQPSVVGQASVAVTPAAAAVIQSTADESIAGCRAYLRTLVANTAPSYVVADVYDATDLITNPPWDIGTVTVATCNPAQDAGVSGPGAFIGENGATTNLFQHVNESGATLQVADYVDFRYGGMANHTIRFHSASVFHNIVDGLGVIDLTGKRIAQVRVHAWLKNRSEGAMRVYGELMLDTGGDADVFTNSWHSLPVGGGLIDLVWNWTYNPATNLPWTNADLAQFLVGGVGEFGIRIRGNLGPAAWDVLRLYAIQLEVVFCDETRVATGAQSIATALPSGAGWVGIPFRHPVTGVTTPWSKTAGRIYWLVLHQPSGVIPLVWYFLDGDALPGISGVTVPLATNSTGLPDTNATWPPAAETFAPAIVLRAAAGGGGGGGSPSPPVAFSGDGQPYSTILHQNCSVSRIIQQDLTPLGANAYGIVAGLFRAPADALPTATLDITVIDRTAAGVVVDGPVSIHVGDLGVDTGAFQSVLVEFPAPFTANPAHAYAIQFMSSTDDKAPWRIAMLDTQDPAFAIGAVGYGGETIHEWAAGVAEPERDLVVAIAQIPPTIGGVTASVYVQTLGATGPCAVTSAQGVVVTWAASTLPSGAFGYYEIQRSDTTDGKWCTVARFADESATQFYDFEGRRNTPASYRIRQIRGDGGYSLWSSTVTATPLASGVDMLIVTNQAPWLNVGYIFEPDQTFDFLSAAKVVVHQFYGRDYQVAFRPLEYRGDHFKRTVTVAFNNPSGTVGRRAFDSVEPLTRAPVPYLCVLDPDGNRWFASVVVATGQRSEPGGRYHADVDVTEVTADPAAAVFAWNPGSTPAAGDLYGDPGGVYGDPGGTYAN